jgi:hypothetical protein
LVANFYAKPAALTDDMLVIHLRGGDEARLRPLDQGNQYYGQPPCYYFLSVIRQFNKSLLLTDGISHDGRWNPCHNLTIQAGAQTTEGDLHQDLERMSWSRNFVLSVSTRSFSALWMSPVKKRFWTFNNYFQIEGVDRLHPQGSFKYFGNHWNCVASQNYTATVLQRWAATEEQFGRLLTDKCNWTNVRGISPDNWALGHVHRVISVSHHIG